VSLSLGLKVQKYCVKNLDRRSRGDGTDDMKETRTAYPELHLGRALAGGLRLSQWLWHGYEEHKLER
jgi:hypothetical protein